ncbi:MAG: hypothetical protein ACFFKA_04140 [Candidatus Thorarchaeota archaeon]
MSDISCASLKSLENIIKEKTEVWCVDHDSNVFKSKIGKAFCNSSSGLVLSVRDDELAKKLEGNKYLNATQLLKTNRVFVLESQAKEFAKKELNNLNEKKL